VEINGAVDQDVLDEALQGGDAAARRNSAPTGFLVSPVPPSFAQVIQLSERDGFEPHESESERDLREVGLSLRDEGDRLQC